jgi:hypothetical protein
VTSIIRSAIAAILILATWSSVSAQYPKGLYCLEPNWDWGGVGIEFDLLHDYKMFNGGNRPITLESVVAPCDCSLARVADSILKPGDSTIISLRFSTKDFYGRTTKAVDIVWRDSVRHSMQLTYSATVGQYFGALRPEPINLFFITGQTTKKVAISNPKLSKVEITKIEQYLDILDIKIIKGKAAAGEQLELETSPKSSLTTGTHVSNFRLTVSIEGESRPLLLTVPVKIVRY